MRDILGTDIKLTEFEISIVDGDIELLNGAGCVKQDLSHAIQTPLFFWGKEMDFGSRIQEFVQGGVNPFYYADLKRSVNEVFERESRVMVDSWVIKTFRRGSSVEIECEFLPIDQETPQTITEIITNRG